MNGRNIRKRRSGSKKECSVEGADAASLDGGMLDVMGGSSTTMMVVLVLSKRVDTDVAFVPSIAIATVDSLRAELMT